MARVVLSLPRLGVHRGGFEKNKEIYVISFSADLSSGRKPRSEVIAAHNETLSSAVHKLNKHNALKFMSITVSNVFNRVRKNQPVSLTGSGILLYPHLDPQGLLANHFMIVESDQGVRTFGQNLEGILNDKGVKSVVKDLLEASATTQPLIAALMRNVIAQVPNVLKKNKDDLLFCHSHSGFDFDNYGAETDREYTDYEVGNDRAYATLRIRVRE